MPRFPKDPLLAFTGGLLWFFIGLFVFAMAICAIGIAALLFMGPSEFAAAVADADVPDIPFWAPILVIALVEPLLFVMLRFCIELRRIVRSVDEGDPFHPDNAGRLSRMGWLALAGWALSIPIATAGFWLAHMVEQQATDEVGIEGSLDGVLLALVLFILARVFRQGAAMREDLEGTV